jgi:hypothetical protein
VPATVLALALWAAQPVALATSVHAPESAEPAPRVSTGNLQLGPDARGRVKVLDAGGATVADVTLRPGDTVTLPLPPGDYRLLDAEGRTFDEVKVKSGESVHGEVAAEMIAEAPAPTLEPPAASGGPAGTAEVSVVATPGGGTTDDRSLRVTRRSRWRRIGAPILSALIPGLGQAVNRQPGRAIAFFTGTASLALASAALWTARDPTEGATPGDAGRSDAQEVLRLGAFSAFTGAAGLLYLAQIMDAHAVAAGKRRPRPAKDYAVALSVTRSSTVGFAPGQPAYDLYTDWSVAVLGQILPRLTFGLSDASIKWDGRRDALTVQAGAQVAYRFFDRRRVWLSTGGGVLMQGSTGEGQPAPIEAGAETLERQRRFSVVPYVHFETRIFVLDRWYLGLQPRVSVPLLERRFRRDQALPRYATTFELGLSAGVLF